MNDMIRVKSVAELAKEHANVLGYVRDVTERGGRIYFEKEDIDTSSFASELLLTIYLAFGM